MRSPFRWFLRRREFTRESKRRLEIEAEFSAFRGTPVELVPARSKGGYDQIYHAMEDGRRIAVVRVNSPHKRQDDPIGPDDPGVPLGPQQRLDREWDAYSKLFPLGLSPEPLWRTGDAIACSWIRWRRASLLLVKRKRLTWSIIGRALSAISRMHGAGVIHLDFNTGNFLMQKTGPGIAIIDFEFGPVSWVDENQQRAFDYLRLVNDVLRPRRGGKIVLTDPGRLEILLDKSVPEQVRAVPLGFCLRRLNHIGRHPDVLDALLRIFPRLREEGNHRDDSIQRSNSPAAAADSSSPPALLKSV